MTDFNSHRIQTILGLIQSGIIVLGSLLTGVALKAMGYPDRFEHIPWDLLFVRNWGFLLIAIPLTWAGSTIWMERHQEGFSKRWTMISGLLLAALLVFVMIWTIGRAGSSIIGVAESSMEEAV